MPEIESHLESAYPPMAGEYGSAAVELAVRPSLATSESVRPSNHGQSLNAISSRLLRRALEERLRIAIFALNGIAVFCSGLLIQVSLVEYAHQSYVPSYVIQTIASVQINFLLSRWVTWRDRDARFLPSLVRFNFQQLLITGLGMAAYSVLERLHVNYILANVMVTGTLAPVSFLSSHTWSIVQGTTVHRHRRKL